MVLSSVHGAVMQRRGLWERERGREGRLKYYGFKLGARSSDAKEREGGRDGKLKYSAYKLSAVMQRRDEGKELIRNHHKIVHNR